MMDFKIGEDDINNTVDAPSKNIGMDLKIPESVTEMHLRDFHLIVKQVHMQGSIKRICRK